MRLSGGRPSSEKPPKVLLLKCLLDGEAHDRARGRAIGSRAERRETERNGYRAQAHMQNALNFSVRWGDIWTSSQGYNEEAINNRAEKSISAACGDTTTGSCQ